MPDTEPTPSRDDVDSQTAGGEPGGTASETVPLTVVDEGGDRTEFSVERGRNLRRILLEVDRSPYAVVTRRLNCGGRGLCATCGVRIREGPPPEHWHDRLAERFGYPRLSCQVTVDEPMTVELVDKRVWGSRASGEPTPDR